MMMWRSLKGRTICQAAEAVAQRRASKDPAKTAGTAEAAGTPDGTKIAATILPADTVAGPTGSR